MAVEDGRGKYMKQKHKDNRAKIDKWESENTGSMMDCSKDTKISYACVRAHFAEKRVEAGQ